MTISIRDKTDPQKIILIPKRTLSVLRGTPTLSARDFLFGMLVAESERRVALLLETELPFENHGTHKAPVGRNFEVQGVPLTISLRRSAREDLKLSLTELLGLRHALLYWIEDRLPETSFKTAIADFCSRNSNRFLAVGFPITQHQLLDRQDQYLKLGLNYFVLENRVLRIEEQLPPDTTITESSRLAILIDRFEIDSFSEQRILSAFQDLSELKQKKALLFLLQSENQKWTAEPVELESYPSRVFRHPFEHYCFATSEQEATRLDIEAQYNSLLETSVAELRNSFRQGCRTSPDLIFLSETLFCLERLGLGHLSLKRTVQSLSTGEYRRILLARNQFLPAGGSLLAIEEPSYGLHPSDQRMLRQNLEELCSKGHTVVVSDEQNTFANEPSRIISLSKLFSGPSSHEIFDLDSARIFNFKQSQISCNPENWLRFSHLSQLHLKDLSITLPCSRLCCFTGISGSGKSTLLFSELVPRLQKDPANFKGIVELRSESLPTGHQKMLCSYLGILKFIAGFLAGLETSRIHGFSEKNFALSGTAGSLACKNCKGVGYFYLRNSIQGCQRCQRRGFSEKLLTVRYRGLNFRQILSRSIHESHELLSLFRQLHHTLSLLFQLHLSHLRLDSMIETLSLSELQRLSLVKILISKPQRPLFIALDEPCAGLNAAERKLMSSFLRGLADEGNTICAIEHSPDFLLNSDYIIDLGPGAGCQGGQIIFSGTPQEMLDSGAGSTANELRTHLSSGAGDIRG